MKYVPRHNWWVAVRMRAYNCERVHITYIYIYNHYMYIQRASLYIYIYTCHPCIPWMIYLVNLSPFAKRLKHALSPSTFRWPNSFQSHWTQRNEYSDGFSRIPWTETNLSMKCLTNSHMFLFTLTWLLIWPNNFEPPTTHVTPLQTHLQPQDSITFWEW